mgnify:FL=1
MRAVAGLIQFPSDEVVDIAIEMANDSDESVRQRAFALLGRSRNQRAVPILIRALQDESVDSFEIVTQGLVALKSKDAAPALLDILNNDKDPHKFTFAQIYAGNALAAITDQKYKFTAGRMFCGNPPMEGAHMVAEGKKLGGERGQALAARGQEILTDWDASVNKVNAEARVKNVHERERFLKWWTANGKRFSPPNHSVERPAAQ